MLPDFPELKTEVQKIALAKLRHRVNTIDPVLSQVKRFTQHEGRELRYERVNAPTVQNGPEALQTKFDVHIADVPYLVGEKLDAKLEEIAQEMAAQQAKLFFRTVGESCDEVGNTLDAGGKPLTAELILEMIDSVQAEFGSDGKPTGQFVIHPDMALALKKAGEEFDRDPELQRRHAEILKRQREEWATRQSNRKSSYLLDATNPKQ
jgi:hypothetical protein